MSDALQGWIGVDLDGTLAMYEAPFDWRRVGPPVPRMLARVKRWLAAGRDVRIFTARVSTVCGMEAALIEQPIRLWCRQHLGRELPITCRKDYAMVELWDDRAIGVVCNEGVRK